MTDILLAANFLVVTVVLLRALWLPQRLYEYPALAGMVYLGFVLRQAMALRGDDTLPAGGLALTLLIALLSYLAILLGWWRGSTAPTGYRTREYDTKRLLAGTAALSLFGAYFSLKLRSLPAEMLEASLWTGLPVAYLFFAKTQLLGFAIACLLFLRTRSRWALLIAIFDLAFFVDQIVIRARREIGIETALVVLIGCWFCRRWMPGRTLLVAAAVSGMLFVNSTGAYRGITTAKPEDRALDGQPILGEIRGIDFIGSFLQLDADSALELTNAVFIIAGRQATLDFDLGASYWNNLVFQYVPAQWTGQSFKNMLTIVTQETAYRKYDHVAKTGTTLTGFSDSFGSFWMFGAVVFFLIAYMLGQAFRRAMGGSLWWQFFYVTLVTNGMIAITHSTGNFLSALPYMLVFSLPLFWFAKLSSGAGAREAPRPNRQMIGAR